MKEQLAEFKTAKARAVASSCEFLAGGGEMGALMRAHDWSRSPLGPPEQWPDALKMAVSICLNSRFPMLLWWGPEFVMVYNDAYRPILGMTKHPASSGQPRARHLPGDLGHHRPATRQHLAGRGDVVARSAASRRPQQLPRRGVFHLFLQPDQTPGRTGRRRFHGGYRNDRTRPERTAAAHPARARLADRRNAGCRQRLPERHSRARRLQSRHSIRPALPLRRRHRTYSRYRIDRPSVRQIPCRGGFARRRRSVERRTRDAHGRVGSLV